MSGCVTEISKKKEISYFYIDILVLLSGFNLISIMKEFGVVLVA
jgi:hypothetical protein